jgi:hypothetical protein
VDLAVLDHLQNPHPQNQRVGQPMAAYFNPAKLENRKPLV